MESGLDAHQKQCTAIPPKVTVTVLRFPIAKFTLKFIRSALECDERRCVTRWWRSTTARITGKYWIVCFLNRPLVLVWLQVCVWRNRGFWESGWRYVSRYRVHFPTKSTDFNIKMSKSRTFLVGMVMDVRSHRRAKREKRDCLQNELAYVRVLVVFLHGVSCVLHGYDGVRHSTSLHLVHAVITRSYARRVRVVKQRHSEIVRFVSARWIWERS